MIVFIIGAVLTCIGFLMVISTSKIAPAKFGPALFMAGVVLMLIGIIK